MQNGTIDLYGGGTSTNSKFVAATNAAINVTYGGATATWDGTITGSGGGMIFLNSGAIQAGPDGVVLNFRPDCFTGRGER